MIAHSRIGEMAGALRNDELEPLSFKEMLDKRAKRNPKIRIILMRKFIFLK